MLETPNSLQTELLLEKIIEYSLDIPNERMYDNKYFYLAIKYSSGYRIANMHTLVRLIEYFGFDALPSSLVSLLRFHECLVIPNILAGHPIEIVLRGVDEKVFAVLASKKPNLYKVGNLKKDFKYGDSIVLCEGSADCDYLRKFGTNVCAVLTDSLSWAKINALRALTSNIVLAFDNDQPGQKAQYKERRRLQTIGFSVSILKHPNNVKDAGDCAEAEMSSDIRSEFYEGWYRTQFRMFGIK